ncbi:MAG: mechanosensitive ion channel family protein [Nitrospirota bacterium]
MKTLLDWLPNNINLSPEIHDKLIASIAAIFVILFFRWVILKITWRHTKDLRIRYQWRKSSSYIGFFLAALFLGRIWFKEFQSVATFLGLLTAGLAIALKDLVVNLAGWAFIMWRRPFEVGDRIQIGSHSGDVIDLRIFQFTLMEIGNWVDADQSTGRIIHIPNGKVFNDPQINYTRGWFDYIWNEVAVLITFESNWKKAKGILQQIALSYAAHLTASAEQKMKEASRQFMIFHPNLQPVVYTSIKDSGVLLTVRYLCEPRRRRDSTEAVWEDILNKFAECDDIDFAYPTWRFYNNILEGRHGTRPSAPEQ